MLHRAGVDAINIADGPRASARMSPMALATIFKDQLDVETIIHYCCRDRNLLGMQADLIGAHALRLRNILMITGDPPKHGDYPSATAVFDVDAIGLSQIASRLNQGMDLAGNPIGAPTALHIGVGANPGAVNLDEEMKRFLLQGRGRRRICDDPAGIRHRVIRKIPESHSGCENSYSRWEFCRWHPRKMRSSCTTKFLECRFRSRSANACMLRGMEKPGGRKGSALRRKLCSRARPVFREHTSCLHSIALIWHCVCWKYCPNFPSPVERRPAIHTYFETAEQIFRPEFPGAFRSYIALGDSMSIDDYPGDGKGAATLLYRNLDHLYPEFHGKDLCSQNPDMEFLNLAQDGASSRDVLHEQLPKLNHSGERTLLTVTAGGNDILSLQSSSEEVLFRLKAIVDRLQQLFPRGEILIGTIYDPSDGVGDLFGPDILENELRTVQEINHGIRALERNPYIRVVEIHKHFLGHGLHSKDPANPYFHPEDPSLWYVLTIEPNSRGAHEIRKLFWLTLQGSD